jgi:hypothetical protein
LSTEFLTGLFLKGLITIAFLMFTVALGAQDTTFVPKPEEQPTLIIQDSLTPPDSISIKTSSLGLEGPVHYAARDSIRMDLRSKKAYLYGNTGEASITYQDMEVKAAYIEIDFEKKRLDASFLKDSTGKEVGRPLFKQGKQEFKARQMSYGFESKKGLIREVITQEGEGYLHGGLVKRDSTESSYVRNGSYTTCSLDDPHFEIRFPRAKLTADKKIITGPAYLVIQHVPTPLFVPFGFFPAKKGRASGIMLPTYGESANRGFFLENGGYYWGLNEHWDLALKGDIYSRGSWALKTESRYSVRYKFDGRIALSYAVNVGGDKGTPSYEKNKDFRIEWSHSQNAKARPNSRFNASVIAGTSKYNAYNPTSANDYLSNTFSSGITYSTRLFNRLSLTSSLGMTQNTQTGSITLNLPQLNLSSGRIYPFKLAVSAGKPRWYERISVNYTMDGRNTLTTYDSLFVFPDILDLMQYGVKHYIPVNADFKLFKHLNLNGFFNYTERWYWNTVYRNSEVSTDIDGFRAARDFNLGANLNTRLYGQLDIVKGPVASIRHVITPTAGISYTPDFTSSFWGYFQYYLDANQDKLTYSIFESGIYGAPPAGNAGIISLGLSNNVEMKVRSNKDSLNPLKKVRLIDNLSFGTSYNMMADSVNWSPLNINFRTILFRNVNVTYTSVYSFYQRDSSGQFINSYAWEDGGLLDLKNFACDLSFSYNLSANKRLTQQKIEQSADLEESERNRLRTYMDEYIDFDNPWTLTLDYSFRYGETYSTSTRKFERSLTHSVNFNGDISLTPKWKVGLRSGYDFIAKDFTYTSIDVYRDLHCWEMTFSWIPTGYMKSYNFMLRVKATMLQDLKLTKKTDFRDRY